MGGADSWGSIEANNYTNTFCAMTGLVCITLSQMALHRLRKNSTYNLTSATIAFALSMSVLCFRPSYTVDEIYHQLKEQKTLAECGGNPSMMTFCRGNIGGFTSMAVPDTKFVFLSVIPFIFLWFAKIYDLVEINRVEESNVSLGQNSSQPGLPHLLLGRNSDFLMRFSRQIVEVYFWVYEVLAIVFLFAIGMALGSEIRILSVLPMDSRKQAYKPVSWNMGQIVAVLIWSPVLAKYVYSLLCKPRRLPPRTWSYKLTIILTQLAWSAVSQFVCLPTLWL